MGLTSDPRARLRQQAIQHGGGRLSFPAQSSYSQPEEAATPDLRASQAVQSESVPEAIIGLFPDLDHPGAAVIGVFLQEQGASDRCSILMALRARGGSAVLSRANAEHSGINLVHLSQLEEITRRANPAPAAEAEPEGGLRPWIPTPNSAAPGMAASQGDPDSPADFGVLRPYLDAAEMGEPTRHGIPTRRIMDDAIRAASQHSIPHTEEIQHGRLPKEWGDRPLASWIDDAVRKFWASSITGAAGVGDCLNRLAHVATVAKDIRYSAAQAERAAVRYDALRAHGVCLDALKARSGEEVRAWFRLTCEQYDAGAADRLLAEEAATGPPATSGTNQGRAQKPGANATALESLRSGFAGGAQVCQLWGLGACSKSESACGKAHVCPFCGSSDKACFLKHPAHLATFRRHGGVAVDGKGRGRQSDRSDRRRSRSRSQRRDGRRPAAPFAPVGRAARAVKRERSPSHSPLR